MVVKNLDPGYNRLGGKITMGTRRKKWHGRGEGWNEEEGLGYGGKGEDGWTNREENEEPIETVNGHKRNGLSGRTN